MVKVLGTDQLPVVRIRERMKSLVYAYINKYNRYVNMKMNTKFWIYIFTNTKSWNRDKLYLINGNTNNGVKRWKRKSK